jgi:hypothetical protein
VARSYESRLSDLPEETKVINILDEKKHNQALTIAEEMEAERNAERAMLGRAFARDADTANAFSKLSRYETAIERTLYCALHALERFQAARLGKSSVPPPLLLTSMSQASPKGIGEVGFVS